MSEKTVVTVSSIELLEAKEPLNALLRQNKSAKSAYWLGKAAGHIAKRAKQLGLSIEERRMEMIKKYGAEELDDSGKKTGRINVTSENDAAFRADYEAMLAEKIELEVTPINIADLERDGYTMTPEGVSALSWLLAE